MRRSTLLPIRLLLVFVAAVTLILAVVSCANGAQPATPSSSSTAVPSRTTLATTVSPTSSVLATPTVGSVLSRTLGAEPTTTANPSPPFFVGTAVPFRTLAQGFRLSGALPEPTLLVAVDGVSLDAVVSLIDQRHQALLKRVDLEREAVVAAFWGVKHSGGFSITVSTILIANTEITVNVVLQDNDPAFPRIDAATLPYHLVAINRSILPKEGILHYRLVSGDKMLAVGKLPR